MALYDLVFLKSQRILSDPAGIEKNDQNVLNRICENIKTRIKNGMSAAERKEDEMYASFLKEQCKEIKSSR